MVIYDKIRENEINAPVAWLGGAWGACAPNFRLLTFKFSYSENFCRHQIQEVKLCRFWVHADDTVTERVITVMQF